MSSGSKTKASAPRAKGLASKTGKTPSKTPSTAKIAKQKAGTPTPAKAAARTPSKGGKSASKRAPASASKATGKGAASKSNRPGPSGSPAGPKNAGEKIHDDTLVVCGKEVCGRKLDIWDEAMGDWRDGEVIKFKPSLREHLIRFLDGPSEGVSEEETWFDMSKQKFRWLSAAPEDAAPNPSYRKAPKRKAAVGCTVKVYWTGMGKWYLGKVLDYDNDTKLHTVKYRDGDVQTLSLRHEAVIYVDGGGKATKTPKTKKAGDKDGKNGKNGKGNKKASQKKASAVKKEDGKKESDSEDGVGKKRSRDAEDEEAGKKKVSPAETQAKKEHSMHMSVIGSRLGVYDPDLKGLKRGTVEAFRQEDGQYQLLFDNGKIEWLTLGNAEFRYLSPKTRSGGCGPPFVNAMDKFGAEQMKLPGEIIHPSGMEGTNKPAETISRRAPVKDACINWRLSIRGTDKKWYLGEVVAYHQGSDRHVVLYDDGEHEVIHLPSELIAWHVFTKETKKVVYPGKPKSMESPSGSAAVGWRVAVFWPAEKDFFRGKVTGYDEFTKALDVSYDDGDRSIVRLADDKIKWVLPPGTEYDTAPFKHRVEVIIPICEEDSGVVSEDKKAGGNKKARQQKSARKFKSARVGSASASPYGSPYGEGFRHSIRERQELMGEPVVVRNISSAPMFPVVGDGDGSLVQSAISVRIYLSDSSRDSADVAKNEQDKNDGTDNKEDKEGKDDKDDKDNNSYHSIDEMMRRVNRAEESVLKGLPTYLPASGEDPRKAPQRLDKLLLNPKMVIHRKSNLGDNDSEVSDNLNNNVHLNNSSSFLSRFQRAKSPLGMELKAPAVSSSGSSDDEGGDDEELLISPHHPTAVTGMEEDKMTDIFTPNDAPGPIESPFSEPAIQAAAGDDLHAMMGVEMMQSSSGLNKLDAPEGYF